MANDVRETSAPLLEVRGGLSDVRLAAAPLLAVLQVAPPMRIAQLPVLAPRGYLDAPVRLGNLPLLVVIRKFPVEYEDPCGITSPRIFATITTETETIKVGVHPLRDSAAMGGFAEPRLLEMGPISKLASDPSTGAWSAQTASMRWADTDRANRERADARTSLRNCDVSIYLVSEERRRAEGQARLLFAGKIYSDQADRDLVFTTQMNDLIGVSYSLFAEEKQIPQREVTPRYFQNAPESSLGIGEQIVMGRRAPKDPSKGEGVVYCPPVGLVTVGGVIAPPVATTLADLVAALQDSKDRGQLYVEWGPKLGFTDMQSLQDYAGSVPTDYDGLAYGVGSYIGCGGSDLDAYLAGAAVSGGVSLYACLVASHAISEVLNGSNGQPSIWINDTQIDPAQIGVSVWCPQIPGDTTWATAFGANKFTDIIGTDGTTRRYTLILFDASSPYGTQVAGGARVHIDCVGAEFRGDGEGTPILDYFDIYRHLVINFLLQDYQYGPWLSNPTFLFADGVTALKRVYEASFDAAGALAAQAVSGGFLGSLTIRDRRSIRDVIQQLNLCGTCLLAQDDYQRLFIKKLDQRRAPFLQRSDGEAHRTLRDRFDFLPGFTVEPKPDWQVNNLAYQYAFNDNSGAFERGAGGGGSQTRVIDQDSIDRDGEIKRSIQLDFIADDATATAVATYYVTLFARLPRVAKYARRGLCGLEDDPLQGVPITHYNGYGEQGWQDHAVWILGKTFNPKTMHVEFTALDVHHLLDPAPPTVYLTSDPVSYEYLLADDGSGDGLLFEGEA